MGTGYKELDNAIKGHLTARPGKHPIYSRDLLEIAADELGTKYTGGDKEWRLIDRRLQALKKAGEIRYARPAARWELVSA